MKQTILYTTLIISMLTSGCSKYLDVNDNPNLIIDPPINGLLATTTMQTGWNVQRMGDVTSYYVQYLASSNTSSDRDIYKEEDLSNLWTAFYNNMTDIQRMNEKAVSQGATQHLGVGKIMVAIHLNMLINMFGDVPYSQSFNISQYLLPAYDDQEALHGVSIQLLDEGVAELNKANPVIALNAASDVIHAGDVAAWKRTASTLKARFLNQLSKRTDKYNPANILAAVTNGYRSNADDAGTKAWQGGRSPWNQVAYNNTQLLLNGWLSQQLVDAMDGTTFGVMDPRLKYITDTTKYGDYRGTPNGAGRIGSGTDREESVLSINGFYSGSGAPTWIATYAELKFIESEAAFRANDKQRAYAAYREGIKAHIMKVGGTPADTTAYLSNASVSVGAAALTLADIFREKYIVMFLHPEAWVDARRFDFQYKDFTLPVNASLTSFIRRAAYPVVETSRNRKNIPPVTGLTERLWWDQ
jgi:hypothetical protein